MDIFYLGPDNKFVETASSGSSFSFSRVSATGVTVTNAVTGAETVISGSNLAYNFLAGTVIGGTIEKVVFKQGGSTVARFENFSWGAVAFVDATINAPIGDTSAFNALLALQPVNFSGKAASTGFSDEGLGVNFTTVFTAEGTKFADTMNGGTQNDSINGRGGDDYLVGNGGNDKLVGAAGKDKLIGGKGNDNLKGGSGNDILNGGKGNDKMDGAGGNDKMIGGAGKDKMNGKAGNDNLNGGAGADRLDGSFGSDTLNGGGGNDTILGGAGDDKMIGGKGNDLLIGEVGDDSIKGGAGNDGLSGGGGTDILYGGAGDDTILGDDGLDELFGGDGADILHGGFNIDTMTGGADADSFVFAVASDSFRGASADKITDFQAGIDEIDLSGMVAGGLTFIGSAAFSNVAGEVRVLGTTDSKILIDVDGDGIADSQIDVLGVVGLIADDFVL